MRIYRLLQRQIEANLFKRKVVVIYGARQVGKTTLVKELLKKYPEDSAYFNCDEPDIRDSLTNITSTQIKQIFGNKKIVAIDEAQRIENIGLTLKLAVDNFPEIQIIATGSSSFELSNSIIEPLTGRKIELYLYPIAIEELLQSESSIEVNRLLENRIIYGMYPEIIQNQISQYNTLLELTRSYLYKDILQYQSIKNPNILDGLLQALALQIGNEVSYNELAILLQIDKKTVERYIDLLEKAFIIFRLNPLSRNQRHEISSKRKIYFYDTGIRNMVIKNLNSLNLRQDKGALWENFIVAERKKYLEYHNKNPRSYFWRTYEQQEIDYLEEENGILNAFEIKWSETKWNKPSAFKQSYPETNSLLINNSNYLDFLK